MNQKSNLNIKKEKEKDENKSVNIIKEIKEILNKSTQLNDYIKELIKMEKKIIEIKECININKIIIENFNNISKNLNKYNQDFEDENEKCFNNEKTFEILDTYDNSLYSNINYEYINFCEKEKTENIYSSINNISTEYYTCSICNNNESTYICNHCNQYFCKECFENIESYDNHNMINIKEIENKAKKKKSIFLNSIEKIIKTILLKCNELLNYEKISTKNMDSNKDQKDNYILRLLKYPFINKINDFESQLNFLKQLDEDLKDLHNNNTIIDNNNSFYISKLNRQLIMMLENIFIDEDCNLFREILKTLEYNKYDNNYDFVDENDINYFFNDDISLYESIENNMSNDNQNEDENFDYLLNKYNQNINKDVEYFEKLKNEFYFVINLIPKKNFNYNQTKFPTILSNKINYYLSIDKENLIITCNNGINFIDTFITTSKFNEMSIESIEENFSKFNKLKEFKILYNDLFCNEYNLREYLDYKGNFIIPDRSCNINNETEEYNPPYGWIGIGLKVIGKYEDDNWLCRSNEWAIAYHGVGRLCSFNQIKKILYNIIVNGGLIPGSSQRYINEKDKRHEGRIIGSGIYLTKDINIAEEYSGIIPFNSKKYKIVLMAKVLIDKIREPENYNYWILNNEDIRIYRVLLKEIK